MATRASLELSRPPACLEAKIPAIKPDQEPCENVMVESVVSGRVRVSLEEVSLFDAGCDAVVNPANMHLNHAGGVAKAIRLAAGPEFDDECRRLMDVRQVIPTGASVTTRSGQLTARGIRWVVHTVGPVYDED